MTKCACAVGLAVFAVVSPTSAAAQSTAPTTYAAATDRTVRDKPALPAVGGAGYSFSDPVFGTPEWRITDAATRPGSPGRSFRTPSATHQSEWSAAGSFFYVVSSDGTVVPFAFDAATGTARRLQPTPDGEGGLILQFYIEPQFSYVTNSQIYGSYNGPGGTRRTIDQYDFATGAYTTLADLDALVADLNGTYVGSIASSAGDVERILTFFGGSAQDLHHYVLVFDKNAPANRHLLDTVASTLDGAPIALTLDFHLHHAFIDRSGRYVFLYPTGVDRSAPRNAAPVYLWDLQTGVFTEMPGNAAHTYGHDAYGYGTMVNQDCCTTTSWDAAQWQFRWLSTPLTSRDLIVPVLSPEEIYLADHPTWNNARPDALVPYVTAMFRAPTDLAAWRAWDDEVIAVQTDVAADAGSIVWRFVQHRSDVSNDLDPTQISFWYEPRANVSQDGRWALFTSNWEKTLGTEPGAPAGGAARQDVFLLRLDGAVAPPPPPPVSVSVVTASLDAGRATVSYAATLQASGGSGVYSWTVASGTPPAGVALNGSTGALSGTPQGAGTYSFTVTAADATNPLNAAAAALSIDIMPAVQIVTTSLPDTQRNGQLRGNRRTKCGGFDPEIVRPRGR